MSFNILNKNATTFIEVPLRTKKITIPKRNIKGPYLDTEMSPELQVMIQKGQVMLLPVVRKQKSKNKNLSKGEK